MRKKLPIYQLIFLWLVHLFQWDWEWLTQFGGEQFYNWLENDF